MTRTTEHQQDSMKGKWESSGATKHVMVYSIGYIHRNYPEEQDTKAEKLGSCWKLKDRNVTVVNLIQ